MMKFNQILLATITTLSLTLASHINVAQAGLARGTDLQIHRSIDNDDAEETTATTNNRARSMKEFGLGWNAYKKDEHLNALDHFYQAVKIDSENPYAYLGLALVSGKTSQEGVAFMTKAAELFEQEKNQEGYDLALEWLQAADQN
jgi:hypothetical protein